MISLIVFNMPKITLLIFITIENTVKKMQLHPMLYCICCSPIKFVKNMK